MCKPSVSLLSEALPRSGVSAYLRAHFQGFAQHKPTMGASSPLLHSAAPGTQKHTHTIPRSSADPPECFFFREMKIDHVPLLESCSLPLQSPFSSIRAVRQCRVTLEHLSISLPSLRSSVRMYIHTYIVVYYYVVCSVSM